LTANASFTIAQAARSCGLPESTLRYYEQIGVLPPARRDPANGYRVYAQDDLDLLDVVACLAGTGMPVSDLREYIAGAAKGRSEATTQLSLMQAQRARLEQEAEALAVRRRYVDLKVAYWQAVAAGDDGEAEHIGQQARPLAGQMRANQSAGRTI
jgi:DNA-binding transcriptional MerR regulator